MTVRSVVKIGGSYYVSLPKNWIKDFGIFKAKQVDVRVRDDGVLEIVPLGKEKREFRIKKVIASKMLDRLVMSAYLAGYEIIEVHAKDMSAYDAVSIIENLQKKLVGLEIVEESNEKIVLQCFTKTEYDISSLLSRMDSISRSMYIDGIKAFEGGDIKLAESVKARDDRLDRIYFLAVRILRTKALSHFTPSYERLRIVDFRLLARDLEELGDIGEEIASLAERGKKESYILTPLVIEIAKLQRRVVKKVLGNECQSIFEIIPEIEGIAGKISGVSRNLKGRYLDVALHINNILRRIRDIADLSS